MARETKVGLLAGLAFIICFAIILANRGRQEPADTRPTALTDRGTQLPASVKAGSPVGPTHGTVQRPERVARSTPTGPESAARSNPVRKEERTAQADTPASPVSGSDIVLPRSAQRLADMSTSRDQSAPSPTKSPQNPMDNASSLAATTTPVRNTSLTLPTQDQLQRKRELKRHLDAVDSRHAGSRQMPVRDGSVRSQQHGNGDEATPAAPERFAQRTGPRERRGRRYTVRAGDTLTRIAAQHYGRASASTIQAIFEANRAKLDSPDDLHVNVELVIPDIPRTTNDSNANQSPRRSESTPARTAPESNRGFRWYQIRPNDRYESIAREQLGDGTRWREIFELNKDKFPDPQRIRHGVRIKLPAAGSVVARKQ